ncbi:hypothetical protein SELR_pSRC300530 (plasmid) [Selenomonas ruminantium subsp. lactilytica TAM6421]|uniref:Uncharacterized protein n=1 Tax=Selenomonas ruminantium subsp. lactilytica (strain NBRC 103574 / TAM6421) TaxID=927704 RepID=I0GWI9_SELRL|nr:hypothetical protein [Selenomonas ruminantium]BAL85126.1 hypothetical protein SELR_pSRC300530 [Selenomonas ruminantium subsp. lactilytica TAM6421]
MNTVLLSWKDAEKIFKWAYENKSMMYQFPEPLKNIRLVIEKWEAKIQRYGNKVKIHHWYDGKAKGTQEFKLGIPITIIDNKTDFRGPDKMTMVATYAALMAYMVYAPKEIIKEPAKMAVHAPGGPRKAGKGYTYILHRISNKAPQGGHHRSPQGTFTVRGHHRHYKNGKTIWIREYTKGTGENKERTYKL